MYDLTGSQLVAGRASARGSETFRAVDPATGRSLDPPYYEASVEEISEACHAADEAFVALRRHPARTRARLLDLMAEEIDGLGDVLVDRVMAETGYPEARVRSERGRTTSQLRIFAELVRDGSWVDARIDHAHPERRPIPKPDLRRMLIPIGPIAVFAASNFPLAFSVAGGDTASALAAGCPVVLKAHPAHPGTSEFVARAVLRAVERTGLHAGTFSLLHATRPDASMDLVRHSSIRAVGFTGSLGAGRAIYDAAASRPDPIPVYAEMGSVNPVFVLPGALEGRTDAIADGLVGSVTLGSGQFCTSPGLVFAMADEKIERFVQATAERFGATPPLAMLNQRMRNAYLRGIFELEHVPGVAVAGRSLADANGQTTVAAAVLLADDQVFRQNQRLHEEVFGPSTVVVRCASRESLLDLARGLEGNLTASIHGTEEDLKDFEDLVEILTHKVGRVIFNGFPTGVEVCPSMHHGGPYPATTDVRATSVGTAAIYRFARPVCYQGFPDSTLPPELQDANPQQLWRIVDGGLSKE